MAQERRFGRFSMPLEVIENRENHPERNQYIVIMSACWIVRAETMYISNSIEYIAQSNWFRPLEQGERTPYYVWRTEEDELGQVKIVKAIEVKGL